MTKDVEHFLNCLSVILESSVESFLDGGGSSVYVLLSLVNKETALAFLIGQPLGGWSRQNRMLGERSRVRELLLMKLPGQTC